MKKIILLLSVICITSVIVWGIFALPLITKTNASDTDKKAEQHFEKAVERIRQLMYEDAIVELEKVIELVPESEIARDAQYWIGQSYYKAGKYDDALSTFEKLTEEYPESAIIPVTQLMMTRVQQEKENEKLRTKSGVTLDKNVIIDPKSGVKFTKIFSDEKLDVIGDPIWMTVSPDGRFLFTPFGNWVVPLEEGGPFKLDEPPVAEMAGPNLFPSWSPDGSKISFLSEGALWVIPVSLETRRATGPARKLVEGVTRLSTWSPDGKMIAYAANGDIWRIPATGGTSQQITDSPMSECRPAWSSDGSEIAFVRVRDEKRRLGDIWLISPEGKNAEKIIENSNYPRWSGDGKYILFLRRDKNGSEKLWIFQLSSKRECKIELPDEWRAYDYCYSTKDGKLLFFDAGTSYRSALKVVSVYGGPSMDLCKNVDANVWPYYQSWSPDGKWIITTGSKNESRGHSYGTAIWMVSTSGRKSIPVHLEHVTEEEFYYPNATWSPDGDKLAYLSRNRSLWVVPFSPDTGQPKGLPTKIADDIGDAISWSPNARKIAFTTRKSGNADIWVGSVIDGKTVRLTDRAEDEMNPRWSPDGEKIAYVVEEKGLWVIPATGGEPKQIIEECWGEACSWSPDAKKIAFAAKPYISIIDVANGEVKHIVDTEKLGAGDIFCIRWSPDGKNLAFLSAGYPKFDLWVVPATGGSPTKLATDDPGGKYWLYWSPDGKRISYNSDAHVKLRTAAIWEADFEEIVEKLSD